MSPVSTSIPLPEALRTLHADLVLIAEAWLDSGAAEVAVIHGAQRSSLAGSSEPGTPALRAPLAVPKVDAELEVVGADAGQLAHLFSDAELVGRLARRDQELCELTDAVLTANDQLVAMHDLATTSATGDDVDELCNNIADDALRLTGAAAVVIAGLTETAVAVGSHPLRDELTTLAQPRVDGIEILRPDETTFSRPVIVASVPDTEAGLAIAGHDGQVFDATTADLVGAVALRAHAHTQSLAHREVEQERAHCSATSSFDVRLTDLGDAALPQPAGASVAFLAGRDDGGTPDFAIGTPTRHGGVFAYGTTERTGAEAAISSMQRTNLAWSAVAATFANADDAVARPVSAVATILEGLLHAHRDSGDRPEPTAGTAIVEWHQRSGIASVATTGGITVVARQGGRTQVLDATHTLFGTTLDGLETAHAIRLSPGDALLLVSDGLVSDPGGLRAPLGLAAVEGLLRSTTHHRGDELLDQLLVLAQRHAGGRRLAPPTSAFALVVDGTP